MAAPHLRFEITRLDAEELATYPGLSNLYDMINQGFREEMKKHPGVLRPEGERFDNEQQLLDELGSDVILLLMREAAASESNGTSEGSIVATASYKPYKSQWLLQSRYDAERKRVFGTSATVEETEAGDSTLRENKTAVLDASNAQDSQEGSTSSLAMEIVAVVVARDWQRHGLASQLVGTIAKDVNSKARASNNGNPTFKLWARTAREINEPFWHRQGFTTVGSRFFEAGWFGSVGGFHLVDLVKEFEISEGESGSQ